MSESEIAVVDEGVKKPFQPVLAPPPREVVSSEGVLGQFDADNGEIKKGDALEVARCDARQEKLRVLLKRLKRIARETLGKGDQFSPKEIGVLDEALDRVVEVLDPNARPVDELVPCPSWEELATESGRRMHRTLSAGGK